MKQDMRELRKIQSQGITDNAQYPAGTYIVFTAAPPTFRFLSNMGKTISRSVLFATKRRGGLLITLMNCVVPSMSR